MTLSKYNDLMNNVVVTEDMKKRILQNIEKELDGNETNSEKDDPKKSLSDLKTNKKVVSIFNNQSVRTLMNVAAAVLVVTVAGIAIKNISDDRVAGRDSAVMSESAKDKNQATETAFEAPREDSMLEGVAAEAEAEAETTTAAEPLVYKTNTKAADYVELTGDEAQYSVVEDVMINNITATFRGNDDAFNSAMWSDEKNTYAVFFYEPVPKEAMIEEVKNVIAAN